MSVDDKSLPPLGIRLSEAVDEGLQQLRSSRTPEKEHSAIEGVKGSGNDEGNESLPLPAKESAKGSGNSEGNNVPPILAEESAKSSSSEKKTKSSRTSIHGPWGDMDEDDLISPPEN